MDIGIFATGVAAIACIALGRPPRANRWLRHVLLISWLVTLFESIADVGIGTVVFSLVMLNFLIAGAAVMRVTHDPSRVDAKVIGNLSMMLMPAHFIMSASLGKVNWTLYASACNIVFILQCLVAGGWLDGVGRCITRFVDRLPVVHPLRRGGR